MKRMLVACGSGIATSTMTVARIGKRCEDNGTPVSITQYKPLEVGSRTDDFDLLVTTGKLTGGNVNIPMVGTVSLLAEINEDATLNELLSYLK